MVALWLPSRFVLASTVSTPQRYAEEATVGTLDELRAMLGDNLGRPAEPPARNNWIALCCCGHLSRYHSEDAGGEYQLPPDGTTVVRGEEWTTAHRFTGCVGAVMARGLDEATVTNNPSTHVVTRVVNPTCPCTEFRPVAKVDRPNRYWNQRMPAPDNRSLGTHPLIIGIRAFTTHLSRRKPALADPTWADREFERRFVWTDRVCGISKCTKVDDVWPVFVSDDRSELRCAAHR
jgi:hypothetical protein